MPADGTRRGPASDNGAVARSDTSGHRRRVGALGLAAAIGVAVVAVAPGTAVAGDHHDPKAPEPKPERVAAPAPPATDLSLEHVGVVQVGRGEGGGVATATVRNADDEIAEDVAVAYELGSGTTFDASRSSEGCLAPDTLVVCPLGDLAPGRSAEVAVGVRVPASAGIGSVRLGVFRQPTSAGWDPAAGEWIGVEGTWRGRFTALVDGRAVLCALDLPADAEVRVVAPGATSTPADRVLVVAMGEVRSRPVDVVAGTEYQIEVLLPGGYGPAPDRTPIERWEAVGLVAEDEPCDPASAGALGITGRWRSRSDVRLVVAPGARLVVSGAVWGAGPDGRTASVAVRNLGPDPAPAVVELRGSRARPLVGTPCDLAPVAGGDAPAASCRVTEIRPGERVTLAIGVMDGADLGRWVATLPPTSADPAASSSQERP